jgi:hypothetical protein
MVSSQTADVRPPVVAPETRQKTTPAGSGCGGWADEPVAPNDTMTFWHARSRQTSTVELAVALSGTQVRTGRCDVEVAVDSGAISRGAGCGVFPGVGGGVEVGVDVAVGDEVGADCALGSIGDFRGSLLD